MQTFEQIQFQVGAWGMKAFGNQETPYLGCLEAGTISPTNPRQPGDQPDKQKRLFEHVVELGGLIPLMEIVEELCTLATVTHEWAREDTVGNILITLCDYCCRENIIFPVRPAIQAREEREPREGLIVGIGRLYQCHRKRHQRLDGFHDIQMFKEARADALRLFIYHLVIYTRNYTKTNVLTLLNKAWNRITKEQA